MFKKQHLALAIAATLAAGAAHAELETSVVLKNETAYMTKDGNRTGEASDVFGTGGSGKGIYKFENTAQIYLNGEAGQNATWHGELKITRDSKAVDGYEGHNSYSQQDFLRELYVDTTAGDWDVRAGKQQVVWGTADGIKLLDIVNPTDWREFNQNTMAESRVPVWMVNAEKYLEDGSNVQVVISQAKLNTIAGMNESGDQGHPFIMKGVDTISGKVNGFYNIAPALGNVAATFQGAAMNGAFTQGNFNAAGLTPFGGLTVDAFASSFWDAMSAPGQINMATPTTGAPGYMLLNTFAQYGFTGQPGSPYTMTNPDPNGNFFRTNLVNATGPNVQDPTQISWSTANPVSAFEYMPNATFATFNTFTKFNADGTISGISTEWKKDIDDTPNLGGRFRKSLDNGLNFSVNYLYHTSSNPSIDLSWVNGSGETLTVQRAASMDVGGGMYVPNLASNLSRDEASQAGLVSVLVHDDAGNYYGALNPNMSGTFGAGAPTLRFTEESYRVQSIGGSFDYAVDTASNPVVIRGEFVYDKNEKQPVVDRYLLSIGDLTNALKMEDADYFKYVIGADTTVLTDMMVSGQFIQFRNLDFVDTDMTCTNGLGNSSNCGIYTADFPTMSLTNGMQKAEKNKNFYSLFFSKPFGESGEGRWNNIFIFEEGGGKWNRFDIEYGLSNQLIGTFEYNKYWGDNDTMFGQFENASNVQIGLKYLLQ
jgi:hypothetical protein